jgi:hypothetical protein
MKKESKLVQAKLSEKDFKTLNSCAREKGISTTDLLRKGIQLLLIMKKFEKEGKPLLWEDPKTKQKTRIII